MKPLLAVLAAVAAILLSGCAGPLGKLQSLVPPTKGLRILNGRMTVSMSGAGTLTFDSLETYVDPEGTNHVAAPAPWTNKP